MKRVVIVRHAKSVPYGYDDDFNRKLTDRGKADATLLSSKLLEQKIYPDLIISSPAKRALKTARIYAEILKYPESKIFIEEELYEGVTTQEFIDILSNLDAKVQTVFIFGHNPTVQYLAGNLLTSFNSNMPTCSTVGINLEIDNWNEVSAREGNLEFQLIPSNYR